MPAGLAGSALLTDAPPDALPELARRPKCLSKDEVDAFRISFFPAIARRSNRAPRGKTEETGSGEPNGFGLYNVTGNAAERVQDCYVNSFASAPRDGTAVVTNNGCQRVLRGGGWKADPGDLRIASRSRLAPGTRDTATGFRVVAAP